MKKLSRASRWLAWGVIVVAAIFIPWGTFLLSSVNRSNHEFAVVVDGLRALERIEREAFHAAHFVADPDPSADARAQASWFRAVEEAAREDPALLLSLDRVQQGYARLVNAAPASTARAGILEEILRETVAVEKRLAPELSRCSLELRGQWKQLNFMAILSCALAVTLATLLFAFNRSVAELRRVEAEEETLRAELARVGRLSLVGEMGTKVAHELNQPLGAIHNYIAGCVRRLRQREGDHTEMIQALEQAADEAKRASSIIRSMRDFARDAEPSAAMVEMNDLVREMLPLLSVELRDSKVEVELDLAEGLPPVLVDRIQIGQVLVNLIRNSLEAMSGTPVAGRRLVLGTRQATDRMIEVSVEDTGCGLPPELLPHLFQPFHTTKARGMGIGLAISRTIVEAHEGWIRAESRPGQGTIFRFQLPCPSMVVTA